MRELGKTVITAVFTTAFLAACGGGGSDGATSPAPAANATYQGVFASGNERGTISLTAGSPATGSVTLGATAAVSLSGTYTASTKAFSLSGGGYTVQGTAANSTVTGTVTGTGITGVGTMSAVAATSVTASTRYCGVYTGDDSGMFELIVSGGLAAASVTGMGGGFAMTGTASGSGVSLSVSGKEPGTNQTNTITVNATISGTNISGTGSSTLYPTQKVTLTASSTACSTAAQAGPYTSYTGFAANNGSSGLVELFPTSPATGSIAWNGAPATALSGTFDAATGRFVVSGGGITLTATANGAALTGVISGPPSPLGGAGVLGMGSSTASPAKRYCGTASSPISGKVLFTAGGTNITGILVYSNTSLALNGTAGGTWAYLAAGTTMFLAGAGSTTSYTGTWAHTNNTAGSWTVSGC